GARGPQPPHAHQGDRPLGALEAGDPAAGQRGRRAASSVASGRVAVTRKAPRQNTLGSIIQAAFESPHNDIRGEIDMKLRRTFAAALLAATLLPAAYMAAQTRGAFPITPPRRN